MTERKVRIPMDVHNAFRECREVDQTSIRNTNARVDEFLVPLLTALSKKRPRWSFVATNSGNFNHALNACFYDNFTIMESDERLGQVWVETSWRNRDKKYAFDNARLRASRQRGNHTETKDVKKATKIILENVYALTGQEIMSSARSASKSQLQTHLYTYHHKYGATKQALAPVLENLALDKPDVVKAFAPQVSDKIDTLLAQHVDVRMALRIQATMEDQKTTLLVERGGKVYAEPAKTPGQFTVLDINDLADHYKQVVGVLKLAPVGTLLPDLGFRAAEDTFVAFDPPLDTVKDNP